MSDIKDSSQFEYLYNLIKKIVWNPFFGIIAGGLIGYYFYYASIKEPNLTYYISPTSTAIVQTNNLNNFEVKINGKQISGNLSSEVIQIWNQGKAPIHRSDIEKTIRLKMPNGVPIYQVSVTQSRSEIEFSFINTNLEPGTMAMDWKILEHNDGFQIQIIYGGSVNLPIILEGSIEGQLQGIKKYNPQKSNHPTLDIISVCLYSGMLIYTLVSTVPKVAKINRPDIKPLKTVVCLIIAGFLTVLVIVIGVDVYGILTAFSPPPFGF